VTLADVLSRFCKRKPSAAIYFRNFQQSAQARGPFNLKRVANQIVWIYFAFKGPRCDSLSASLRHVAQRIEPSVSDEPCFFVELTLGCLQRVFALLVFALRNRPCSVILFRPEWAADLLSISARALDYLVANKQLTTGRGNYPRSAAKKAHRTQAWQNLTADI
jgi:hypothetical protein